MEILIVLASFIIALILFLGFRSGRKVEGKSLKLPPGNLGGWPFIGETIAFTRPHSSASLGPFLDQHIAKYGRIFKMNYLGKPTIVSADPDFNRLILQSEGRLFQNSYPKSATDIFGQWSMLVLSGDMHKEMRSIVVYFMNNIKLHTHVLKEIDIQAVKLLDSWKDNSTFSAMEEAKKFAFGLMVKYLVNMDAGIPETEEIRREYEFFMKGMSSMPLNLPGTAYRRALQARSAILKIVGQKLDKRIQEIQEGCQGLEEVDLLSIVSKNSHLRREQILDLILNLLFASYETTSVSISLTIFFLHSSPNVLNQLREEHTKIATQKKLQGESGLKMDDYKQMRFTHCVVNETLRLGNIVKYVHRKAIKDVHYKGYDIPCGWEVLPILSAAHLDESIYDDPQSYNPWRWESIFASGSKNCNVMSFGGGPRLCLGAELAKLEMAVFLHHLVQRFDWELAENDYPVLFPFLDFPKHLPIKIRALK